MKRVLSAYPRSSPFMREREGALVMLGGMSRGQATSGRVRPLQYRYFKSIHTEAPWAYGFLHRVVQQVATCEHTSTLSKATAPSGTQK